MKKALLITAIATGLLIAPTTLLQAPAEAGVWWSIGSNFSVGGLDFTMVFGRPYGSYGDGYYYRTAAPFRYSGYSCHNGCSLRDGYHYHHRDCPLVRHHFRHYRFRPSASLWFTPTYYGPYIYYDGYRYDRWRGYRGRYDRHRHKRYKYDRHRSKHHRYDHHRYDRRHYSERYRGDRDRGRNDDWDSDSDRYDRQYRDNRRGDRHRREFDRHRDGRRRSAYDTRRHRHGGG